MTVVEISKADGSKHKFSLEDIGYDEHKGDTVLAGKIARDIYTNWDNVRWRNAFILSLGEFCENQVMAHKDELERMIRAAHVSTVDKARRAVVKSYLVSKASVKIDDYTKKDGTHVSGYTQHRPGAARRVPVGDDPQAATAALLAAYNQRVAPDKQAGEHHVAYHIEGGPEPRIAIHNAGDTPHLGPDEQITHVQSLGIPNATLSGHQAYNLATQLGANAAVAGSAGAVVQGVSDAGKGKDWFDRLASLSKALHYATGGGAGPVPVQVATAMGEAVGQHGAEVSRVLGPGVRRYSYKYRGMTASPEQVSEVARLGRTVDSKGAKETNQAFEHRLLLNLASSDKKNGGLGAIPNERENALMLQSGSTAPSQGFIVDPKGKVVQQAVGHADDHYVPFNLAKLHALKNGSYVRSRAYGGPTTEDISLGLRSGASRISTVSRHGIYTIQFDPRANTKRWGYTPRQVTNRYGRLLEAINAGKVNDPETNQKLELNERGYEVALQSLKHQYPFLIQAVYHQSAGGPDGIKELEGHRSSKDEKDTGYVLPMYLKPGAAMHGYHDVRLGGARRYDDMSKEGIDQLRGYRTAKATKLLMDRQLAQQVQQQAQRPAPFRSAADIRAEREQTGSSAPSGVPQRERERSDAAGGTDTGAPVRSYTMRDVAWDESQHAAMMKAAEDLIRHHIDTHFVDGEFVGDPAAAKWAKHFSDVRKGEKDAVERDYNIKTGEGGAREDLLADINDLYGDYSGDDKSLVNNLTLLEEGLHENIGHPEDREAEEEEEYKPYVDAAGNESPSSVEADPEYQQAKYHGLMDQWRKTPNLGDKKRKEMEDWFEVPAGENDEGYDPALPKAAYWNDPDYNLTFFHPADESLTPYQQAVNRFERAHGRKPIHHPKEDAEPTKSEVDSGVRDDMSEEEKNRMAQEWAERMLNSDPDNPDNPSW